MNQGCNRRVRGWNAVRRGSVNFKRGTLAVLFFLTALCPMALMPTSALAGTQTYGSVMVNVEPPADVASGWGYAVYRITVSNRDSAAHTVRVTLPADSWNYGDSISSLSRTLQVGPLSTASTELLQPPMSMQGSDALVSIDGKAQRERVPVALVEHMSDFAGHPILASRGVGGPIKTSFETAMEDIGETSPSFAYQYMRYGHSHRLAALARAERPVGEWSANWLAYSRYFMVMLTEQEFNSAPAEVHAALRDYVAAGGHLAVIGTRGRLPDPGARWGLALNYDKSDASSGSLSLGLGQVDLLVDSRLAGFNTSQWKSWISKRIQVTRNLNRRLDAADAEQRQPMLKTIKVPTRGLLGLMLLFTVVIGPANLVVLSLLKRRMWLLWTIPVIAFTFAGAVLAYSLLSEGIKPRANTVAITLLDQTTRQAVTLGSIGYYAPLTPGGGLHFDGRTEVAPQTNSGTDYYDGGGRSRSIDNTNDQHLARGWIVARVPAHFALRKVENRRERLDISRDGEGNLTVVNGLGLPIKKLYIADEQGDVYVWFDLAPGASQVAAPTLKANTSLNLQLQIKIDGGWQSTLAFANRPQDFVSPGTYIAVLDNASLLDPGMDGLKEHKVTGVVAGLWKEGE